MVRENGRPVPPELTELLSEIERELTELLPQAADRRPTLEAERERLERQIRGWTQSLGNPDLHPAVRTSIERETTQGHERLLEIEDELRRESVCERSAQEAVDAEAALERLERLADILQEECPTLANLELSMHIDRIDCRADGRAVLRTCKLGSTPGALDLLSLIVPLEVDERGPPPVRRARRRARLRVNRFDEDADDRLAAADMAADPERFAGLPDEWFWIDEFAPPDGAVSCWSVDNANRIKQYVDEYVAKHGKVPSGNSLSKEFGVARQTALRALAIARGDVTPATVRAARKPTVQVKGSAEVEAEILRLYREGGLEIKEIANRIGCGKCAVNRSLDRSYAQLGRARPDGRTKADR
jgi:predicted DNA-binding protein (UPF0251 family)